MVSKFGSQCTDVMTSQSIKTLKRFFDSGGHIIELPPLVQGCGAGHGGFFGVDMLAGRDLSIHVMCSPNPEAAPTRLCWTGLRTFWQGGVVGEWALDYHGYSTGEIETGRKREDEGR